MNMKKILGSFVVMAALLVVPFMAAQDAQAAPVDLNKFTCEHYNALGASKPHMIFWFHGYTVAMQEGEVFDDAKIEKFATALEKFCKENAKGEIADALVSAMEAAK